MPNHTEYNEKNFTPSLISITSTQFLELVDRAKNGTPASNGWGVFECVKCRMCGYAWAAIAMFNTKGKECPNCLFFDAESIWREYSEFHGEGAFLNPVGKDYSIVNKN